MITDDLLKPDAEWRKKAIKYREMEKEMGKRYLTSMTTLLLAYLRKEREGDSGFE